MTDEQRAPGAGLAMNWEPLSEAAIAELEQDWLDQANRNAALDNRWASALLLVNEVRHYRTALAAALARAAAAEAVADAARRWWRAPALEEQHQALRDMRQALAAVPPPPADGDRDGG